MSESTIVFAGKPATLAEVRGTLALLRYWRRFLRSPLMYAAKPDDRYSRAVSKREARAELSMLIHVAINRKGNLPQLSYRKFGHDYQAAQYRDCARVRNRVNLRYIFRPRDLETRACRERFAHLAHED